MTTTSREEKAKQILYIKCTTLPKWPAEEAKVCYEINKAKKKKKKQST